MLETTSREELEEWLERKPLDWTQILVARVALRALPFELGHEFPAHSVENSPLVVFRATCISWAARSFPEYDMAYPASLSARQVQPSQLTGFLTSALAAVAAGDSFYRVSSGRNFRPNVVYGGTASILQTTFSNADHNDESLHNFTADYAWLSANEILNSNSRGLAAQKLWLFGSSNGWSHGCRLSLNSLLELSPTYQVWIDWYNRRIQGHDAAFDIPGDTDRTEDKKILARLADATDEDFWGKGATYVNTTLQGWIDEARGRIQSGERLDEPPSLTPDAIRAVAAEIASPTVTLTNNQLDVTTNTAFDGQTDAANLDEAIAILRAVVGALLGGLPGNAPRSFAANLTIYDGELAKRDAKPFLGVLVRMEKSVSAGFHADPEMFDAGVTTNFESYFEAHLAFMTHYRRNEEREAKIAQFRIDDAAASGVALTGPVDEVVKEVDALAEQGLVTDGFVQAMKEQQAINDEVALYTSSVPTISGESTVKKRIILQTVGILERALAAVNNVVSATAQFGAFVKVVKQAIAELLKFFI